MPLLTRDDFEGKSCVVKDQTSFQENLLGPSENSSLPLRDQSQNEKEILHNFRKV
jgi:hypothetical protein